MLGSVRRRCLAALRRDDGTVTAEFALALPAVALVLVLMVGALQAGSLHIRVVDAASIAARSLGRGESSAEADARVTSLIGGDHALETSTEGDFICAMVSAPVVLGAAPALGLRVTARTCALEGGR